MEFAAYTEMHNGVWGIHKYAHGVVPHETYSTSVCAAYREMHHGVCCRHRNTQEWV